MDYYQIFNVAATMYLVCVSPTIVILLEESTIEDAASALWIVSEKSGLGGSTICCKVNNSCIEIGGDRKLTNYEILVLRQPKQPERNYLWNIDRTNKVVTTLDGEYAWNLHTSKYFSRMPVQLYNKFDTESQKFEFIKKN